MELEQVALDDSNLKWDEAKIASEQLLTLARFSNHVF